MRKLQFNLPGEPDVVGVQKRDPFSRSALNTEVPGNARRAQRDQLKLRINAKRMDAGSNFGGGFAYDDNNVAWMGLLLN
jgi:hypothetical protein